MVGSIHRNVSVLYNYNKII